MPEQEITVQEVIESEMFENICLKSMKEFFIDHAKDFEQAAGDSDD